MLELENKGDLEDNVLSNNEKTQRIDFILPVLGGGGFVPDNTITDIICEYVLKDNKAYVNIEVNYCLNDNFETYLYQKTYNVWNITQNMINKLINKINAESKYTDSDSESFNVITSNYPEFYINGKKHSIPKKMLIKDGKFLCLLLLTKLSKNVRKAYIKVFKIIKNKKDIK